MGQDKQVLGVIGGLGPMATAYFLELIVQMTQAETDQEHLETIIFDRPSTPDRTAYILDHSQPSPLPVFQQSARQLQSLGATCLAIPCVTAHYFLPGITQAVNIPVINALEETSLYLLKNGIDTCGILGTTGTVQSGVLQTALAKHGISCIVPDSLHQTKIMNVIYDEIKAGKTPDAAKIQEASASLRSRGAQCNLLACTELSLVPKSCDLGPGMLDILEVLARACVLYCGKPLRPAYQNLISV